MKKITLLFAVIMVAACLSFTSVPTRAGDIPIGPIAPPSQSEPPPEIKTDRPEISLIHLIKIFTALTFR